MVQPKVIKTNTETTKLQVNSEYNNSSFVTYFKKPHQITMIKQTSRSSDNILKKLTVGLKDTYQKIAKK
jgi:hypothetical protein